MPNQDHQQPPSDWLAARGRNLVTGTLGIPGSASTWVFNVLRELMIAAHGAAEVHAIFSDEVQPVLADPQAHGRHIVWKLHCPDQGWQDFAALTQGRIILTIRDPRDAMLSLMQRFDYGLNVACGAVRGALRCVAESVAAGTKVLRYEDRFFDQPATVTWLAAYFHLTVPAAETARIFDTYATANVRRFGEVLHTLPAHRVKALTHSTFDAVTQIHRTHIGDQQVGKWRSQLNAGERRMSTALFSPWLQALGYDEE